MNTHITLTSKCLHVAVISVLVSARIIPNYHTSSTKKSDESNQQLTLAQLPQYTNFNTVQMSNLEKLVKESLENIFKNQELKTDDANNFGLKTSATKNSLLDLYGDKTVDDVDLSSPHILKVPVPQPYPVHIPVKQPFTVPIFKLVPDEIEKKIPIPVEKLVPVYKEKAVKVIVEKHHPVPVYKPYPVPVPVNTHVLVGNKREQPKWY